MRTSKARWILLAACFLLFPLAASAETPDWQRAWTTVGSAGTIDEDSEGEVLFDGAVVQKGDALVIGKARTGRQLLGGVEETDSAVIRYNVTAVDGMFGGPDSEMKIRFRADGKNARVVARLIELDIDTGAEVTRLTFDSANAPVQSGYQTHEVFDCRGFGDEAFDFMQKAYYIEATLTTDSFAASVAAIEVIRVRATVC